MNLNLVPEGIGKSDNSPHDISIICWPYVRVQNQAGFSVKMQEIVVPEISLKQHRKQLARAHYKKYSQILAKMLLKKQRKLKKKEQQMLLDKSAREESNLLSNLSRCLGLPVLLPISVSLVVLGAEIEKLFPPLCPFLPFIPFICLLIWLSFLYLWPTLTRFILPSSLSRVVFSTDNIEFRRLIWGTKIARASLVRWRDISDVYLRKSGGASQSDYELCFKEKAGQIWSLKFQQIATKEQWAMILEAIDKWCPVTPRGLDRDAFNFISPADMTFTSLWLQSLSEPPKWHRLNPISLGTMLQQGRYVVQQQIGVGGQGRAYLAKDKTGSTVVIKEYILPVYVDINARRQSLETFQRECAMLISLNHPNIVKLIEFFSEDHSAYMVLEYIDGPSLKSLVQEKGPLDIGIVTAYSKTICDILSYLHGRTPPVVHGDLTPENLIIDGNGTIKLIDFTIAQQSETTITSIVAGKTAYMPPEQYQGTITPQSDIYALGATIYYLLIGEDPEPITCLHPVTMRNEISAPLDAIVSKCTILDAAQRYQSAAEVRKALTECGQL